MYKYLFGPVPSRRLGMSLGVDLVPHKVCSLDCIYCECGPTTKLTLERLEYVPFDKVRKELDHYFMTGQDPDYITFSGSGEPTLNLRFGEVLQYVRHIKPDIPVAVLTNGTLLNQRQVRSELLDADVVLPSLDAASQTTFQKINRPCKKLDIHDYIEGLKVFRDEYRGRIWLEVFIIPGYNDNKTDLTLLKEAFEKIRPDRIQLNTLDRPGTITDLHAASHAELQKIISFWHLANVEIIARADKRKDSTSYRDDKETAILETIARRPCTADDLSVILGMHIYEIKKYLEALEAENKVLSVRQERGIFYKLKIRDLQK